MPLISIIVPIYKVEFFLQRCINSILNQTFSDFELILVDDGSPDRCGEMCDEYAKIDNRICVIHQQNGGLSAARNAGLTKSSCEWICFIDSDDCIHPDMLKSMYLAALDNHVNMVVCDCIQAPTLPKDFFDPKNADYATKSVTEDLLCRFFEEKKRAYWTVVPVLIKTAIPRKYPFTVGKIFEDNAVSISWLHEAKEVAFTDQKFYFYMTNPNSITNEAFNKNRLNFLWALEQQISFCEHVEYNRLLSYLAKEYISTAVWLAFRVKNELGDDALSHRVIRKAVKIYKQYADVAGFTEEENRKLFKAAHPFLHRVKKKLNLR